MHNIDGMLIIYIMSNINPMNQMNHYITRILQKSIIIIIKYNIFISLINN